MHKRLLSALCLLVFLLAGCQRDDSSTSSDSTTFAVDTTPPVAGTLETERLSILPWDSGRAAYTGGYFAAETANGFFLEYMAKLYYADKSNPDNWVVVCAEPECEHEVGDGGCGAHLAGAFLLKDQRIYYISNKGMEVEKGEILPEDLSPYVASMALDGTDKREEYFMGTPEGYTRNASGGGTAFLMGGYALESAHYLNQSGTYDLWLTAVDEAGGFILFTDTQEEVTSHCRSWRHMGHIFGDEAFGSLMMDSSFSVAFRLKDRELTSADLSGLPWTGSYLSGDTLRVFKPGEGYYAVDLTTREEMKLADPQLENSWAYIVQPNCIFESAILGKESMAERVAEEAYGFNFFDGKIWWDVALPEELMGLEEDGYLELMTLGSDRAIFLLVQGKGTEKKLYPYQLLLGTDHPTLEAIGELKQVFPKNE